MSLSITLLAFLFLIFPGYTFLKGYYSYRYFSSKHISLSIFSIFTYSIIPAFLVLALTTFIFNLIGYLFKYDSFLSLNSVFHILTEKKKYLSNSIDIIEHNPIFVIGYGALALIIGYVQGFFTWIYIRHWNFDTKISLLRYPNPWYYKLSGEYVKFPENSKWSLYETFRNSPDIGVLIKAILISEHGETVYLGVVESFEMQPKSTGLESITLSKVIRFDFNANRELFARSNLTEDVVILQYDKLRSLKIKYTPLETSELNISENKNKDKIKKKERIILTHVMIANIVIILFSIIHLFNQQINVLYILTLITVFMCIVILSRAFVYLKKFGRENISNNLLSAG